MSAENYKLKKFFTTTSTDTANKNPIVSYTGQEAARIYEQLVIKMNKQMLLDPIAEIPGLDMIFSKEQWDNAIMEYAFQGLHSVKKYDPNIAVKDFNPGNNKIDQVGFTAFNEDYVSASIPLQGLINAFIKPATAIAFTQQRIQRLAETIAHRLFYQKIALLTNSGEKTFTAEKAWNPFKQDSDANFYDDVIDTKTKDNGSSSSPTATEKKSERIKRILNLMRDKLRSYQTPSLSHTKFSRSDKSFKLKFSGKPSDFVWIVNKDFIGDVNDLTANLFNKSDVLNNVAKISLDFNKVDDGLGNLFVTEGDKIDAILVHKKKFRIGMTITNAVNIVQLIKFKMFHEILYKYGYANLKVFPIVLFKRSTSLEPNPD